MIEYPLTINPHSSFSLNPYITELVIESNSCMQVTNASISDYKKLRTIEIRSGCFNQCNGIRIANNPMLSTVIIGENCFNGKNEQEFVVSKCDRLISMLCQSSSMMNTRKLTFSELPSLSLLRFFPTCFPKATEFTLFKCSSLCHLDLPSKSFSSISNLLISSLSSLTRIKFGSNSCVGLIGFSITIQGNCPCHH